MSLGFILLNIFMLLVAAIGIVILWCVFPPDSPWTPWWRTKSKVAIAAGKLAGINSSDLVYELGSGDANFLVAVCKKYKCYGFGIEYDFLRTLSGKLNVYKNGLSKRVILKQGNFYNFKYNEATVVFVYLVPRVLEKLKPKFNKELAKGTKIISYR
jgi:hypothetical protein